MREADYGNSIGTSPLRTWEPQANGKLIAGTEAGKSASARWILTPPLSAVDGLLYVQLQFVTLKCVCRCVCALVSKQPCSLHNEQART